MGKVGRPPHIPSEIQLDRCYEAAKKGLNEEQISKEIGIPYSTFQDHKPEYSEYLKKGRAEGDILNMVDVENAMLKECKGYEYEETTIEERRIQTGTDEKGSPVYRTEQHKKIAKKVVRPNTTLVMFYTVNRSDRWHSINIKDDKGSMPPDKMEDALKAMSEIMDITHGGGERPGDGNK